MAKYLSNIDLNKNQLQNGALHPVGTAPSTPAEGQVYFNTSTGNKKMYYYNGADWVFMGSQGDITAVTSATTDQLTVANSTGPAPAFSIVTATVADNETGLATGDQIHTFVTTQTDTIAADTSGNAATATKLETARAFTTTGDVVLTSANFDGSADFTTTATIQADAVEASMFNDNVISGQTNMTDALASGDEFLISDSGTIKRMATSVLQTYMQNNLTFSSTGVTGTGTVNKIPKWLSGGASIGDSSITDDGTTVTIGGNLVVQGTTTTIDSTTVAIGDNMMKYAKDNTANASDIGWYGKIVASGDKFPGMFYDASTGVDTPVFQLGIATTEPGGTGTIATKGTLNANLTGNVTGDVTGDLTGDVTGDLTGDVTGDVTGNVTGDLTGNADTATALETARNFSLTGDVTAATVSFNGTAAVALNTTIAANVVGATELNVSGNGDSGNVLTSQGDGSFSWSAAGADTQLATAAALIDVSAMGVNTTASFTHGLNSKNLIVQIYDVTTGELVYADVDHTSNAAISVIFAATPTNDIRVVVIDAKDGLVDKTVTYS